MNVELIKPDPTERGFDRGERIIAVDGVRWGRTKVRSRGMHGLRYRFVQLNGGQIDEPAIESRNRRRDKDTRSTEERLLDKAKELVAAGKLRDPEIVDAENKAAAKRYKAHCAKIELAEAEEFKTRAMQATGINDPDSSTVTRVVEAMRWAQSR